MSLSSLLERASRFALQTVPRTRPDPRLLREGCIAFTGSPLQHPYDEDKILLIADPHSHAPLYYAFRAEDVSYVEKLPSLTSEDGEIAPMARIWVKKGAVGLKHVPFIVADLTAQGL